ncbi:hypothetical protein EMIHUDRAFT_465781 [Emiliania huxleyi CCMP1516]|uniref:Uncharacterized protein n=2 Tax=Emiliania huxleyi TaxID=2903 RepID=A0A0D3I8G7_EMIH1|nr:hypothetical protein EMIHUDRAFT_465781 [Emiliania huxleyi CCMP1516]EOD07552.1 hypothetical protein EMIHUDRAFT_465781 [Emiliania huxleyi CCMP1516]|eukprot:XP_005759981.1 hypothetical protein EMIHUDRAFT_465781 [Emiliania huxleyi CCMP1516]
MASSSQDQLPWVEELPDEEPRLIFRVPSNPLEYKGSWQDRPIGRNPLDGITLSYYNNSKTMHNSNILQAVILRDHGFARVERPGAEWNIFWCAGQVDPCELPLMKPHQRVNKFPKANCLTLKANLWTNYLRMRRRFGADAFDFMPTTFLLPHQLSQLSEHIRASGDDGTDPKAVWIVKPAAAYCGRGISLHRSGPELPQQLLGEGQRGVASRYLDRPFLLDGLKSDIRIYVLVTSWHPLTVYQYGEGLARFATEPYTLDDIQATCSNTPPRQPLSLQPSAFSPSTGETTHPGLQGRCAHLTNYSLNKLSAGFVNDDSEASGSKWSLAAFKQRRTPECRGGRGEGAERSLPGDTLPPCRLLREVFGFDVMLDSDAKPWLLEASAAAEIYPRRMLVDLLNTIGVPVPPRGSGPAAGGTERPTAQQAASGLPESGGSGPAQPEAEALSQQECEMLRHVNAELRRSKQGGWRRLFPSERGGDYLDFFDASRRRLHGLPYDV